MAIKTGQVVCPVFGDGNGDDDDDDDGDDDDGDDDEDDVADGDEDVVMIWQENRTIGVSCFCS